MVLVLLCVLASVTSVAAPPDVIVERWLARFEQMPAVDATWSFRPGVGELAQLKRTERRLYRWPDALRREDRVVLDRHGRPPPSDLLLSPDARSGTVDYFLSEAHGRAEHRPGNNTLSISGRAPTLRSEARGAAMWSEYVLARWLAESERAEWAVRAEGELVLLHAPGAGVRVWIAAPAAEAPRATRVEFLEPGGTTVYALEWSDHFDAPSFGPTPRTMRMFVLRAGDGLVEIPRRTLVAMSAVPDPGDDAFAPPRTAHVVENIDSGTFVDAATGKDITRVVRGGPSQRVAWFWWLASVGTGFLVVAGGWWWLRRRGAV